MLGTSRKADDNLLEIAGCYTDGIEPRRFILKGFVRTKSLEQAFRVLEEAIQRGGQSSLEPDARLAQSRTQSRKC